MLRSYQFNFPFTFKKTKIIKIFFVEKVDLRPKQLIINFLKVRLIYILILYKL